MRLLQPAPTWPSSSLPSRLLCQTAVAKCTCSSAVFPWPWRSSYGVGYAAPGTWPHAARDWRGGRVVFPHTTPDGRLVNLYGRAVGTAEQVPKAKRHDHLPGKKGYFNAAALQAGTGPLWVCEGAFDALALRAAGVPRVVAIFGVHGWRWDWVRESVRWSSRSTPIRLGSSSGRRSRGRQPCGESRWPGYIQRV